MSEPIFFDWIEIEAFRGFQALQRFDLDASVILVTGPNGTGKTSLFDALQWLLVGSIQRLEPWRVRRNAEHIVNKWRADAGDPATVSAGLRVGRQTVELRRSGRHDGTQLEWRDQTRVLYGQDAEDALAAALVPAGRTSLRRSLLRSGLLQQDVIRDVLQDKPVERYQQLAAILGLDAIASFPDAAKTRASRLATEGSRARADFQAAETRLGTQRVGLNRLLDSTAKSPSVSHARSEIATRISRITTVRLRGELGISPTDVQATRIEVARLGQILSTATEAYDEEWANVLSTPAPTAAELSAAERKKADAENAATQASKASAAASARYDQEAASAARYTRLAVEAFPLLSSRCPVCDQEIDLDHVQAHVQQLLDGDHGDLARSRKERDQAHSDAVDAQHAAAAAQAEYSALSQNAEAALQAATARDAWLRQLAEAVRTESSPVEFQRGEEISKGSLTAISGAVEDLRTLWRALGELSAVLGSAPESMRVATSEAEIRLSETQVSDARDRAARASAAEEEGTALQRAAVRAATAVTNRRFKRLEPIIQDIYSRLDPHPAFTNLLFAVDVYRERSIASPQVSDPESGVAADPLLVFSSAQANVVALSAFLALGWAAREDAMPFLLLDDPLQSLDDVNALGFADLCRHIRTRRQLIVSTHDKRLAALLERKLAPRRDGDRTMRMNFNAWSRTGPSVEVQTVPSQTGNDVRRALLSAVA